MTIHFDQRRPIQVPQGPASLTLPSRQARSRFLFSDVVTKDDMTSRHSVCAKSRNATLLDEPLNQALHRDISSRVTEARRRVAAEHSIDPAPWIAMETTDPDGETENTI